MLLDTSDITKIAAAAASQAARGKTSLAASSLVASNKAVAAKVSKELAQKKTETN